MINDARLFERAFFGLFDSGNWFNSLNICDAALLTGFNVIFWSWFEEVFLSSDYWDCFSDFAAYYIIQLCKIERFILFFLVFFVRNFIERTCISSISLELKLIFIFDIVFCRFMDSTLDRRTIIDPYISIVAICDWWRLIFESSRVEWKFPDLIVLSNPFYLFFSRSLLMVLFL